MKRTSRISPVIRAVGVTLAAIVVPFGTLPLKADQIWTAGSTTDLLWSNGANWSGAVPLSTDNVLFGSPILNPGLLPNPSVITLGAGSLANALSFKDNYTLSGGDLTLSAGAIRADLGTASVIDSQLSGTAGLTKTGGGSVRLTNTANNYTGVTTINNGIISISNGAALGSDASAIVINGSATRGFGGGALLLEGGYASGVTLSRGVTLQGVGPAPATGAALISVGNNTITGLVTNGAALVNTVVSSAGGRLTMGDVTLGGAAGTILMTFGTTNSLGAGSYAITGALASAGAGLGTVSKTGAGTLFLTPSSAAGYSGIFQTSAGSIRVTDTAALGTSAASNAIDLNGGIFELRTDSTTFASAKRVNLNNGGTLDLLLDRLPGGSGLNQTVTFANFDYDAGETMTINTRNGYGATFSAATAIGTGSTGEGVVNNGNGLVTLGGTLWGNTATSSSTLTLGGTGNIVLSGSVTASGASHSFVKSGAGTLTINGTGSTYTGNTTITGTLSIANLGAINKTSTTGSVLLSTGTLTYTGAADTLAKPLSLIAATASNAIFSNGTGTLTLTGNVGAGGVGAKTLYLGGTNTADNTMSSLILDNNVGGATTGPTGVSKIGNGTWVLKEPSAGAFGSAGSVTIANPGTTATNTLTLTSGTTAGLLVGQTLAGTTASTPPQITGIIDSTHFTVGVNLTTTTAPAGTYTVNAIPSVSTTTAGGPWSGSLTVSSGTLKLVATNAASNIVQNTNPVVFNVDALNANQAAGGTLEFVGVSGSATTESLGSLTATAGANTVKLTTGGGGAAANLIFASLGATVAGSSLNFNTAGGGGGTVTLTGATAATATTLPGTANFQGHLYIDGANFADINGSSQVVAPTYGAAGNFQNAGAALVAAVHNKLTVATAMAANTTISSLVTNSQTLTLGGNLTDSTGAILQSGGTATIQSNSTSARTITGGAAATNVSIRVDGASDVLNLGALNAPVNIASATTGGLTKNGAGTLVINGVNAQTGATTINEGKVVLGVNSARLSGANAALIIRQGATLDLNGQSSGTAIGAFDGAGIVTNSSATAATLLLGGTGTGAGTFSGIIQDGTGVMNVSLNGTTGTPTWSGANTYTGVTTIGTGLATTAKLVNVPILANYGTASGIGRGIQTVVSDANNAASLVFGGLATAGIAYTGTTSVSIDRLFTLAGNFAGAGGQIANNSANNSTLILNKTNALTFAAGLTNAQTLTLGGSSTGDNQINLQLVDNGALRTSVNKIGAGVWMLGNAANSYTGTTTITAGVLGASSGTTLPPNSPLAISGGQLLSSGNFTRNLVATATPGNANEVTWTAGGGFAANESKLVVAIGGTGSPTPLTWASGGFLPTGNLILNSSTALSEVEFRNAIDLNGAARTIQVDDNVNTFADYATVTGVISGTGGLTKTGAGTLQLFGANTYSGATAVTAASTLTVNSLGNSATPGVGSSVGSSTNANLAANAVTLGNAGTTAAILQYVGPGETSDRMIRLNTTTGSTQIHADGAGPLVLTNVLNDMAAGNKTLFLRGANSQGNTITSTLADNGGTLGVTVDSSATWILAGASTYTGATAISGGALGAGDNAAFGTGSLRVINGSLFAYGADRTLTNPLADTSTTTAITSTFIGDYSLNLTGTWTHSNTTVGQTLTNSIVSGKTLTLGGDMQWNSITNTRTLTVNGSGDTILNGNVTTSTAFGVNLTYSGTGSLTLGGTINPNGGALTFSNGTVKLGASDRIPDGATAAVVTISPATGVNATLDLNGFNETINGLTANSAGNVTINNSAAGAATLTVGGNDGTVAFGGGAGTNSITQTGGGAINLVKIGTGTANFTGTLGNTGSTTVNGGVLNYNNPTGTTSLSVASSGTLNLKAGLTTPANLTAVSVAGGGFLSFADGAGTPFNNLTTLSLGQGSGIATLELEAGDLGTDTLTLLAPNVATTANTINLLVKDFDISNGQTYNLLVAPNGGLLTGGGSSGTYTFSLAGYSGSVLNQSDTLVSITAGNLITSDVYWNGGTSPATTAWNTVDGLGNTNFSTDLAGLTQATTLPGKGQKVIFQADNLTGGAALSTTLEQPFKINALEFRQSTTPTDTSSSITIGAGAVSSNSLTIAPSSSADGIKMLTGSTPTLNISAPVVAQGAQSWTVTDATQALNVSGALSGSGNVTKLGAGKLTLSAVGTAYTGAFAVNAGTAELTVATALSGVVATPGSGAAVSIGGTGAFYYNNATASTVPNNLTLAGGTLSAAGNSHTYSGTVAVSSNSSINLRDANSATTTTTQRNITLSGAMSGTAGVTLDSIDTLTAGNAESGTVTINNGTGTWSGPLSFTRGTVVFTNTAGSGTLTPYVGYNGVINYNQFGRVIYRNVDGASLTRTAAINFAAGSLGEFSVDNVGALASNYTLTQSGLITLGSGGTGATVRFSMADVASHLSITGGVALDGNSSISVEGGDADSLVSISTVGISGTGNLAINDEAGAWATTSTRLAINAAGSYSGNTTLNEGTLVLGHKDALSTGSLTITGASSIEAGVNLAAGGSGPVANALNLGNTLTTTGTNNLTFSGIVNNSVDASRTLTNNITSPAELVFSGSIFNLTTAVSTTARTLTVNGTGNTTINNVIQNNGTGASVVTKAGAGTLTLGGANTYTGGTNINLGTVKTSASNVLPNTGTITVNQTAAGTSATLDLNGNSDTIAALTFGGTSGIAASVNQVTTGAGTLTLGGTLTVTATGNWTTPATLSGNLALGTTTRTVSVANSTGSDVDLDIQAIVSGSGQGITKTGAGTLLLSAANTYTGATIVNAGVIRYGINSAINSASAVTVNANAASTTATLDLNNFNGTVASLTLGGTGQTATSASIVQTGTGTLTLGGNVTTSATGNPTTTPIITGNLNLGTATRTFTVADSTGSTVDLDVQAVVSGPGALIKSGAGVMSLSNTANLYTGTTTISAGVLGIAGEGSLGPDPLFSDPAALSIGTATLAVTSSFDIDDSHRGVTLGGAATIDVGTGATLDIKNAIAGSGSLTKTGPGTLTLSGGTSNIYSGGTTVSAGVLKIGTPGSIPDGFIGNVSVAGTLDLNGNDEYINGLFGAGIVDNTGATAVDFGVGGNNATSTFSGIIQNSGGGALQLTKYGTGTLTLSGTNSYTGPTAVTAGVLEVTNSSALGSNTSGTTVSAGARLVLSGGVTILGESLSITSDGSINPALSNTSGSNTWSGAVTANHATNVIRVAAISGSTLTLSGPMSTTGIVFQDSGSVTVSGDISGTGFVGRSSFGTGLLVLSGTGNSYDGNTNVSSGTIRLGASNVIPDGSGKGNLTFDTGIGTGLFDLNGFNETVNGLDDTASASSTVVDNTAASTSSTLTIGNNNASSTFHGIIANSGSGASLALVKTGTGTQILTGSNTFAGGVTISGGVLQIGEGAGFGTLGSGPVTNNDSLVFNRNDSYSVTNSISGSGTLTQNGTGTLSLGASNSYGGKTIVTRGTLAISAVDPSPSATQSLGSNIDLDLGVAATSSGVLRYTGAAGTLGKNINALGNGSDTIQNAGTGLLTLSGTITKAGTTLTLAGGTSGIMVTGSIVGASSGSDLIINGGTTTLASANTYNGPTYIRNGATLNANATDALPTANGRSHVVLDDAGTGSSTLSLGASQSVASITGASTSGIVLGTSTLTIGASTGTTTFAGVISGSGDLVKDDASALVLSGANTYSGSTFVNVGTLQVDHNMGLGTTAGGTTVASGASLVLNNVDVGSEAITINGSGVGGLGALRASGTATIGAALNIATDSVIGVANSGDILYLNGNLTGSAGYTKVGAGTIVVAGSGSTYSGVTTVSSGTLVVNNASALGGTGGGTVVAPGAILELGSGVSIGNEALVLQSTGSSNYGTLRSSTGTNTWGGSISFTGGYGGLHAATGSTLNITGATINKSDVVLSVTGGGTVNVNAVITGDGNATAFDDDLEVNGGTLQLNSLNTYTGPTKVYTGGTLRNGITDALPNSSTVGSAQSTTLTLGHATDGAVTNTYDLNGYNQTVATLNSIITGPSTNIVTNHSATTASTLSVSSGDFAGSIQNGVGGQTVNLVKQGDVADVLILRGTSSYTGTTVVMNGTLQVGYNGAGTTGTGNVTVNSGSTISGSGTVLAAMTISGVLSPGDAAGASLGVLNVGGNLTLNSGSTSYFQIGDPNIVFDQVHSTLPTNVLTLGGFIDLGSTFAGGYVPVGGEVYSLFDNFGSIVGAFNVGTDLRNGGTGGGSLNLPALPGILKWDVSMFTTNGTLVIYVPEPGRAMLLLVGLLGIFARRRRK